MGKPAGAVGGVVDPASASELFLRDNNVLLKPNQWSLSLHLSAPSAEREQLVAELGVIQNTYQSQSSAGFRLRYRVSEEYQIGLGLPVTKQNQVTAIGNELTGTNGGLRVDPGALSASYALLREESGRPGLTVNGVVAPFGEAKSFGAGVALTKSYDRVVPYGSGLSGSRTAAATRSCRPFLLALSPAASCSP